MNERELASIVSWLHAKVAASAVLTSDSRRITRGDVFFAYPGHRLDGRHFIEEALDHGAAAVLWDPLGDYTWKFDRKGVVHRSVAGLKHAAGSIASRWYEDPSKALWSVGVTGTSGKSSVALWLAQSFSALGRKSAFVGTLGTGFVDELEEGSLTTPDPIALQRSLSALRHRGARALAMEVSSIGLVEGRLEGMKFDVAIFTNLTRDHLDYHKTMADYEAAKALLFSMPALRCAVVNIDDLAAEHMARIALAQGATVVTTSASGRLDADLRAHATAYDEEGMRFMIEGRFGSRSFATSIIGGYNVSNLLAVLATLIASDVDIDKALAVMSGLKPAPGRLERVPSSHGPMVLVDYAHKPDALEKALAACRPLAQAREGRLIVVFGCGGDRDAGKRPIMGEIAARLADRIVVTSDNPRSEVPEAIIDAVMDGVLSSPHLEALEVTREPSRREAIRIAVSEAAAGDVVVIAGKGHETYQEINGHREPFSDVEEARRALHSSAGVAA